MRRLAPAAAALALGACAASAQQAPAVIVAKAGAEPATIGSSENFTGTARVEGRFQRAAPARIGGATVHFEAGAHTAWHTHPLGQTLIITAGAGLVQHWAGPVQSIRPGDVVWIPPGVKHWHGASPEEGMTHIAIAEQLDGKSVEWMEKLSAGQYPK
jgi:quercetin dioxygenase-like cupin family protein